MSHLASFAERLDQAAFHATATPQLSLDSSISEEEAYQIQALSLEHRYQRGERFVGLKLGFTSKAKMEQMGVHDMIWGRLTDKMKVESDGSLDLSQLIHPRVEPEICFRIAKELSWPISKSEIHQYVDGVAPALEVIDSRYENFKFSLEDVIADNCSSAAFVIGKWLSPDTPLSNLSIELKVNGQVAEQGNSDAILGDPWESVLAAARLAHQYGQNVPAGSIVLAGAATSARYLESGQQISVSIDTMGKVGFEVR